MIKYNLPGFNDHLALNLFILNLYDTHREMFLDEVQIHSLFGNFHFCIWDGGRNFPRYTQCTKEEILEVKRLYHKYHIPFRFIFTNPELKKEHLDDRFCNLILDIFNNENNEIVVNSPIIEQYLRQNYPSYKLISSTTKRLTNPDDFLAELDKDYFQVCLDYDLNKNMELLQSIPEEKKNKCEFLVNAICRPGCPIRKWHYSATGKAQLSYLRDGYIVDGWGKCTIEAPTVDPKVMFTGNNLSFNDIKFYHDELGFSNFKIEGRTLESSVIFAVYLHYLFKPEYYYQLIDLAANTEGIFYNDKNSMRVGEMIKPKIFNIAEGY